MATVTVLYCWITGLDLSPCSRKIYFTRRAYMTRHEDLVPLKVMLEKSRHCHRRLPPTGHELRQWNLIVLLVVKLYILVHAKVL